MTVASTHQELCRQFAVLFCYPDGEIASHAAACLAMLERFDAAAAEPLRGFVDFVEASAPSRVEEAFTDTFDLQSLCHPYIGYQLCGESGQRTVFMLKLRELYRQFGFRSGAELPDHLTEVLRFLGAIDDPLCRSELIRDGVLPALAKIDRGIEHDGQPYLGVLEALQRFLAGDAGRESGHPETERSKECSS